MSEADLPSTLVDRLLVRDLVDRWMIYRDARNWPKVAELWHEDGKMMTTWGGYATPAEVAVAAQQGV